MTVAQQRLRLLPGLAFGAVFLLGALLGYREIFSPDVGFYLESGRWIVENRAWPHTDPFTWTLSHRPYIDLQWLYQIVLWAVYRVGGTWALVLGNTALTLVSFALLLVRATRRQDALPVFALPVLFLFALGNLWEIRTHVVSWLLLNLTFLALEEFRRGRRWTLWMLPVIQLVWVNCHALFVLGLVVTGIYCADEARRWHRADRRLFGCAALAVLACVVNPYGIEGLLFPLTHWAKLQTDSLFKSDLVGTGEFLSPFQRTGYTANGALVLLQPLLFVQLYAVVAAAGLLAGWRRVSFVDVVTTVAFGFMFWKAQKNFGYFVIATLPAVVAGYEALRWRDRLRAPVCVATMAGCMWLAALWATGYLYAQERLPNRVGHRFNSEFLPVRACEFLNQRVPPGRLLNNWDYGGYVRFATRRPVFIDGRSEVVGEEFYRQYVLMKMHDRLPRFLAQWRPQIALVPFNNIPDWFYHFNTSSDWRCVYADEQDAIYLHRSFAPEVPEILPAQPHRDYPVYTDEETDRILEAGIRRRAPGLLAALTRRHHYPLRELRATAFYCLRRQPDAAIGLGLRGLATSTFPSPDILNNLMQAFLAKKDYRRAARCFDAIPAAWRDPRIERLLAGVSHRQREDVKRQNQ